ncbi:hypothetical protein ACIBSW_29490 [Actinoplanes sp. NPDC049668]|uniref:hypothetical protein n=1 Tax=unclassified Actinoplanes TaxID=2626549 RepID=UPI0033A9EA93
MVERRQSSRRADAAELAAALITRAGGADIFTAGGAFATSTVMLLALAHFAGVTGSR